MGLLKLHPHKNGSIPVLSLNRVVLEFNSVQNEKDSSSKCQVCLYSFTLSTRLCLNDALKHDYYILSYFGFCEKNSCVITIGIQGNYILML